MIITSNTNEQIKNLIHLKDKSKARKTSGTFIVEGIKMFQEIPKEDFIKAYKKSGKNQWIRGFFPDFYFFCIRCEGPVRTFHSYRFASF